MKYIQSLQEVLLDQDYVSVHSLEMRKIRNRLYDSQNSFSRKVMFKFILELKNRMSLTAKGKL